jgi:hypothetical protein
MRQFIAIAILSVLVFVAGYGVRVWVDSTAALPPPPPLGAEFAANNKPATAPPADSNPSASQRRQELVAQIQSLRPQIDMYRKSLAQIDADFDHDLVALLTPVQHDRYDERHRRLRAQNAQSAQRFDNKGPPTDEQMMWLYDRPSWIALDHISVQWKLDDMNKDIKFDDEQYAKVRDLLNQRRDKFLKLVDSVPPPSLHLSQLSQVVQRLTDANQP